MHNFIFFTLFEVAIGIPPGLLNAQNNARFLDNSSIFSVTFVDSGTLVLLDTEEFIITGDSLNIPEARIWGFEKVNCEKICVDEMEKFRCQMESVKEGKFEFSFFIFDNKLNGRVYFSNKEYSKIFILSGEKLN